MTMFHAMFDRSRRPILQITFIALALGGLSLLAGPRTAAAQQKATTVQVPDTADAVVQIHGMMCANCAHRMKGALEKLDGVDRASVQLEEKKAVLTFKGGKEVSEKTLKETVNSAGYEFRGAVFADEKKAGDSGE